MRIRFRLFPILALAAATLLPATLLAQGQLEIVGAYWGAGNNFADVTDRVRSMVRGDDLSAPVNVGALGLDPLPGAMKVLRVYYLRSGQFYQGEWREGMMAQIGLGGAGRGRGRSAQSAQLRVTFAAYGAGNQVRDVTNLMQARIVRNRLDVSIDNVSLGGDPAPYSPKQFRINYEWGGRPYEVTLNENDVLHLPDNQGAGGAPVIAAPPTAPAIRIVRAQYGSDARQSDVTGLLQSRVSGDRLAIPVDNNTMGGDPAPEARKVLYVLYELNGRRMEKRVNEGQPLMLP